MEQLGGEPCAELTGEADPMNPIAQFYRETRDRFPSILAETDKLHLQTWDMDDEWAYMWFHSLADMLNANMRKNASLDIAGSIFDYMRDRFMTGCGEVRNCIDVSFVENLFWQVTPDRSGPYWARMPDLLKRLYLGFHSKPPC
jgi:hypothetical protein